MFDWNLEENKVIPEVTNPRKEVDLSRELFAADRGDMIC